MGSEVTQRVLLIPKNEIEGKYSVIRLKHPKSGSTALCALDSTNKLYEIADFTEEFSQWFVDNPVVQDDGSLYLLKFVDPLFFILPYVNTDKKFYPIEDLLVDRDFPDVHKLKKCCSSAQLFNIFDTKELSGSKVFCYSKTKTLDWLQMKAECLASSLKNQGINIADVSKSTSEQTNEEKENTEALLNCSCLMISDFITEELSIELFKSLGLQMEQEKSKNENNLQGKEKEQNTAVSPRVCKIPDFFKKAQPGWVFLGVIGVLLGSIGYYFRKS